MCLMNIIVGQVGGHTEGTAPVISRHRQLPAGPTWPGLLRPGCSVSHNMTLLHVRVEGDPQPQGIGGARMGFWFAMNHVTCLQSGSRESHALETVSTT